MTVSTDDATARLVLDECRRQFADSRQKIQHCLDQLTDEQLWERISEEQNSVANLLLHLAGNLRQWIVAGLGGAEDRRDRPSEFAERGPLPRADVVGRLDDVLAEVDGVLSSDRALALAEPRRIQGIETNVLAALLHVLTHFQGHTQEIICITRYLLRGDYRFDFVPRGREQGAAED